MSGEVHIDLDPQTHAPVEPAAGDSALAADAIVVTNTAPLTDKLVVVTPHALFVTSPSEETVKTLAEAIEQGGDPAELLKSARNIEYGKVKDIKADKAGETLDLRILKFMGSIESLNVRFDDTAKRDVALEALEIQLAGRAARTEKQYSRFGAAFSPFFWLLFTAGAGLYAYDIAAQAAQGHHTKASGSARVRLFYTLAEFLGRGGVIIVTSLLLLMFAYWLVKRVKNPPCVVTLTMAKA